MIKWNGLLPLGSVVFLIGSDRKFQIIGQVQADAANMTIYDYAAIPFPEGYIDEDHLVMFQQEDIDRICAIGHLDDNTWEALAFLKQRLADLREGRITPEEILEKRKAAEQDGQQGKEQK